MKLKHKTENKEITVNSKKNKIIITKGFITITSNNYHTSTVRPDIIENEFKIPKHVSIG